MTTRSPHASEGPRFLTPTTAAAALAVAIAAFVRVAVLSRDKVSFPVLLLVAGLCSVYAALGTLGLYFAERSGTHAQRVWLLAAMAVVGSGCVVLSGGAAALALYSLISQCVLYLPKRQAAAFILAIGAPTLVVFAWAEPTSLAAFKEIVGWCSGVGFVVAFSYIVLAKEHARAEGTRLARDLAEANERLRLHAREAEELTTTRERNRIAREIHDGLGHYLTIVHVQLQAAAATLDRDPDTARSSIHKAQRLTHEGLEEVRRSVTVLREATALPRPIVRALEELAGECSVAGLNVEVNLEGSPRALDSAIEFTLFRAAQEALTNVRRHARASHVTISLSFTPDERVRLRVQDDGVGAGGGDDAHGFGLLGLRERAELVGGRFAIDASLARGFALTLEVPG